MTDWLTRDEAAAICDRSTAWVEFQRKLGRIAARKELRPVESWNGHAYIHYQKRIWVYCPADARSLRAVLDFNKGRRRKGGKACQ